MLPIYRILQITILNPIIAPILILIGLILAFNKRRKLRIGGAFFANAIYILVHWYPLTYALYHTYIIPFSLGIISFFFILYIAFRKNNNLDKYLKWIVFFNLIIFILEFVYFIFFGLN